MRCRKRLGCVGSVMIALSITVETAEDWKWRAKVHMQMTEINAVTLSIPLLFGSSSHTLTALRRVRRLLHDVVGRD